MDAVINALMPLCKFRRMLFYTVRTVCGCTLKNNMSYLLPFCQSFSVEAHFFACLAYLCFPSTKNHDKKPQKTEPFHFRSHHLRHRDCWTKSGLWHGHNSLSRVWANVVCGLAADSDSVHRTDNRLPAMRLQSFWYPSLKSSPWSACGQASTALRAAAVGCTHTGLDGDRLDRGATTPVVH